MNKVLFCVLFFFSAILLAQQKQTLSYLALGDSYTIGESVEENYRWPNLLADSLRKAGFLVKKPLIIAKTGWRTDELIQAIEDKNELGNFDLVSLLIGVNNQYQGKKIKVFEKELEQLIQLAIAHSKMGVKGVFAVSIPDYGVTPFAQHKNPTKISREINLYNTVYREICEQNKIAFFDITPISIEAANNLRLLASDQLHPSGLMYQKWVSLVLKEINLSYLNQ